MENMGTQILSLVTIHEANLFKISQTVTAINAFLHTPSNSNLLAFFTNVIQGAYFSNYAIPSDVQLMLDVLLEHVKS